MFSETTTITQPPRILVFDSGVGGLSIVEEIKRLLPHCALTYASDNAAFPYGTKTENELVKRVDKVLHKIAAHCHADIIVIACNTASTIALPHIRSRFRQPIVGVVPAIKPAAQQTKTNVIGLLATPGTISRTYTRKLIEDFASHCHVISVGSSELVELAETKLRGHPVKTEVLKAVVEKLFCAPQAEQLDSVVLACTHFPLLREELNAAAPHPVAWIDSGAAIARRTAYLLRQLKPRFNQQVSTAIQHQSLFTADTPELRHLLTMLPNRHSGNIEILYI
ncbi:MAG: glutamate racemase [Exilibacterium sp.]